MTFLDLLYLFSTPLAIGLGGAGLYLVLGILGQSRALNMADADKAVSRKIEPNLASAVNDKPSEPDTVFTSVPADSNVAHRPTPYTDVLVVDDSAVARAKLEKLFHQAGYTVMLACDGVEALAILAEHQFCLMITDLEMPNMDGFELIVSVQCSMETEDMPVIAITGHEEMQARVHDCQGLYGIFKKPWNDRDLLKRVSTLVDMQRQKMGSKELVEA